MEPQNFGTSSSTPALRNPGTLGTYVVFFLGLYTCVECP
jgi:hypothetical protein